MTGIDKQFNEDNVSRFKYDHLNKQLSNPQFIDKELNKTEDE